MTGLEEERDWEWWEEQLTPLVERLEKIMNKPTDSPSPGYTPQRTGNDKPDFAPRKGEGQAAAGARVREEVRAVVKRNGGKPADNG